MSEDFSLERDIILSLLREPDDESDMDFAWYPDRIGRTMKDPGYYDYNCSLHKGSLEMVFQRPEVRITSFQEIIEFLQNEDNLKKYGIARDG